MVCRVYGSWWLARNSSLVLEVFESFQRCASFKTVSVWSPLCCFSVTPGILGGEGGENVLVVISSGICVFCCFKLCLNAVY